MPISETIISQTMIATIVAKVIEKTTLHVSRFRIGMDIPNGIQRTPIVIHREAGTVITLFPKVSRTPQHLVKTHSRIPVEPVHDFWQFPSIVRSQQIMDMVTHNAQRIEAKLIFLLALLNGIEQH